MPDANVATQLLRNVILYIETVEEPYEYGDGALPPMQETYHLSLCVAQNFKQLNVILEIISVILFVISCYHNS